MKLIEMKVMEYTCINYNVASLVGFNYIIKITILK